MIVQGLWAFPALLAFGVGVCGKLSRDAIQNAIRERSCAGVVQGCGTSLARAFTPTEAFERRAPSFPAHTDAAFRR